MEPNRLRKLRRNRRKRGIRKRILGTPDRPRLTVFRSQKHIYAQVIDDVTGKTVAAATSMKLDRSWDVKAASAVGNELAEKARTAGVQAVQFDRNGYKYHGRVKALAEAAREGGLKF